MPVSRRRFLQWTAGAAGSMAALSACGSARPKGGPSGPGQGGKDPDEDRSGAGGGGDQKPTLLILGGTGFLGPHLVEAGLARGFRITLFNRGKTNPHLFPELEKLRGDRDGNLKALEGREFDAVIDTSGYVPRIVRASAELLADAVKHYVFISTISVYANFAKKGITEDHEVGTMEDEKSEEVRKYYGQLKALCEKAAESAMPGRVTNIRPGLIVGPRDPTDRFTYWPVRVKRGGEVLAPGDGKTATQYIDVRDLAEWTIRMAWERQPGVYNATGPGEKLTIGAFLDTCKQATGSDATFTWADARFLEEQKVAPWMQMPMWVPPEGDYLGFGTVDCSRAAGRGLTYRDPIDTIRATLEWFGGLPEERRNKLRAGLPAEMEKAVLAAWHRRKGE